MVEKLSPKKMSRLERFAHVLVTSDAVEQTLNDGHELTAVTTREDGEQTPLYPINRGFLAGMRRIGHSMYQSFSPEERTVADDMLKARQEEKKKAKAEEDQKLNSMWEN